MSILKIMKQVTIVEPDGHYSSRWMCLRVFQAIQILRAQVKGSMSKFIDDTI